MKKILLIFTILSLFSGCKQSDDDSLFEAIRNKQTERVKSILSRGNVTLDPPQQPNQVNKPLAYAAAYGNLEIVELILKNGADINGQVAYGDVPLIKAAEHDNKDIIKYLIERGADVNRPNAFGVSPFIGFCAAEDLELVQLALKHGGKVNESYIQQTTGSNQGKKNYSALQSSVAYGRIQVVKLLLANGGDPEIKDSTGKTCLEIAQEKGRQEIVELLN